MSENHTVARPYAQAVFELAREAGDYQSWSTALGFLSAVAEDPQIQDMAQNPRLKRDDLFRLIEDVCGDALFPAAKSFLRLLIENRRLFVLPNITRQFEAKRAEAEGTIEAELMSAQAVSDAQQATIVSALSGRLGRQVTLRVIEDPSLIGGAILRAGDTVIDASLRGRIQKLAAGLSR